MELQNPRYFTIIYYNPNIIASKSLHIMSEGTEYGDIFYNSEHGIIINMDTTKRSLSFLFVSHTSCLHKAKRPPS